MPRCISIIICLFLLLLSLPVAAFAERGKLSGSAELIYAGQKAEEDGVKSLDAHSFVQQYSLLYSKKGEFQRGRLGEYDLALGYEWNWVDSEINGDQVDIDNPLSKILYRGDIKIAPGGLPFRLHAFSYDMQQTSFSNSDLGTLFQNDDQLNANSGIVTDINNGTHLTTGITLEAGVQNGHYQGQFRDMLATLPRLLIDYKQNVVRDVKGPNPRNYVDRDLAFVSLNKKNNWFHYRRFEHIDKLDSEQNTSEDIFLLGTIDHTNRRQWVNLTNWIQVSTDLSYTNSSSNRNQAGLDNSKRYDANFFVKAQRTRWELDNFTSYSRIRTQDRLEQNLDVPFFARGELNRDTSWRFQLESLRYEDESQVSSFSREREGVYLRGQVETFRQARYLMRPMLELETKSGSEGKGQSGRASLELYSNRNYRSNSDLFASYEVLYNSGTGDVTNADVSYVEQKLHLRMESQAGTLFRLGAEEQVVYGTGQYDSSVSDRINADLGGVASFNGGTGSFDDTLFRSTSSGFVEMTLLQGLKNRFGADYDLIESDTVTGRQLSLNHRLDYNNGGAFSVYWINNYVIGDGMPGSEINPGAGTASQIDGTATSQVDFDNSYATTLRLRHTQGRAAQFQLTLDYEQFNYKNGDSADRASIDESYEYTFWHVNGRIRRLLTLGQKAEYTKTTSLATEPEELQAYSVYASYYPTYNTLLSARLRYELDDLQDTETLLTFLSAGMNFQKFQASVDYSYGRRPETATNPDVLEHKWEVKVKKTF